MQMGKHESTRCQGFHVAGRHDRCALLTMTPGYAGLVLSGAWQRVLFEHHVYSISASEARWSHQL